MSNEENKFDDLLRSKFEERNFSFSEENWEKAERALEAGRRRKKVLWFTLIFLGGLMVGITVMLPFINKNSSNEKLISENISKPKEESLSKPEERVKEIKGENNDATSFTERKATEEKTVSAESTGSANQKSNSVSLPKEKNISGNLVKNNLSKEKQKEQLIQFSSTKKINEEEHTSPIVEVNNSKEIPAEKRKKSKDENTKEDFGGTFFIGMNSKLDSAAQEKVKKDISFLQAKIDSMDKQIAKMISKDSAKTKKDSVINIASIPAAKKDTSTADYYQKPKPKSYFTFSAGANYVRGWYKDTIEGRGWNPTAGFSYTHPLNEKFSLSLGASYHSISNLIQSDLIFKSDSVSFGTTSSVTQITTKKLHYAALSLAMNYTFSKNMIYLGGNYSYLVQSSNTITSYVSSDGIISYTQAAKKTNGYNKAFNSYDAGAFIGYKRKLYRNWGIAGEVYYNFMDVKKDSYFRKYFERNKGARLMLTYDF